MNKSTITREQLEEWVAQLDEDGGCDATDRQLEALIRHSLAAMDSEPVVFTDERNLHHIAMGRETSLIWGKQNSETGDVPLYRHAQPAPVVPEEKPIPNTLSMYAVDAVAAIAEVKGWNACRAAMLQASPVCSCPSGDGSLRWPCPVHPGNSPAQSDCRPAQNHVSPEQNSVAPAQSPIAHGYRPECECSGCKATARICAELSVNSPVIGIDLASGPDRTVEVRYVAPPGYVMVPMRLTAENGAKGALSGEFSETKFVNCPECFGDDECETCDGSGRIEITVPVTWTTIKEIWAKGVEHFAAAPQSPGSEPATAPGKWIPVSERMPEQFKAILAFNEYGEVWSGAYDRHWNFYCDNVLVECVTHWMPLPEAPREVKGE